MMRCRGRYCSLLTSLLAAVGLLSSAVICSVWADNSVNEDDCFAVASGGVAQFPQDSIRLGVLLPNGGNMGEELEALIRLAAWQVNNNTAMLRTKDGVKRKLCILSIKARLDPFSTFQAALQIAGNRVVGVVGPMWTSIGDIVAPLANKAKVPFISPAAFTTAFHVTQGLGPDSSNNMPFLRRICCDNTHTAQVIIDIMKSFRWTRVAMLVTDTDYGHSTSQQFSALARRNDIIILTTVFVPPQVDETSDSDSITASLLTDIVLLKTRVIVNFLWDDQMFKILSAANASNLIGKDYAWIFAELIMERSDLQDYIAQDESRRSLFEGVIFTHLTSSEQGVGPDSALTKDWEAVGSQWYIPPDGSMENFTFNTYGLLAYDVAMLYATALNVTLAGVMNDDASFQFQTLPIVNGQLQLPVFSNGSDFLQVINATVQSGPSGNVHIDIDGKVVRKSVYSIYNARTNGTVVDVVTWNSDVQALLRSDSIVWHGGGRTVPDDKDTSSDQLLRILVPRDDEPFIFYDSTKTGKAAFSGFAIDLLKYFADEVSFTYELHLFNGSWDDMVQMVGRPDTIYDMAIGDITVTSYRELVCDFTSSFFQSSYRILVKRPDSQSSSGLWQFFDPFSLGVWLMLLAFLIFSGFMLYFLEHWHLRHVSPGLAETLWVSFSTFYSTQKAEKITSNYGRFYLIVACFIVMVINAAFTANMTSFLLDNEIVLPYSNLQQVGDEPVGALEGTATWRYLKFIQHQSNLKNVSYNDAVNALESGSIKVFVNNEPSQKYLSLQNCSVAVSGDSFHQEKYAFALKRSSPMRERLNRAILNAWDSGYIEDLYYRRFVWNDPCTTKASDTDALTLSNVGGLFIIVGVAAILCLIGHFSLKRIKRRWRNFGKWSICMDQEPPLGVMEDDDRMAGQSRLSRMRTSIEARALKVYSGISGQ